MKKFINVHKGQATAGRGEVVLKSDIQNRSCFVIVARDQAHKIGCLAHTFFVSGKGNGKKEEFLTNDARTAIDKMISNMTLLGSRLDDIEVSLVASENIKHEENDSEYEKEIERIYQILQDRRIRWTKDRLHDCGNKHVVFDVETGNIDYE